MSDYIPSGIPSDIPSRGPGTMNDIEGWAFTQWIREGSTMHELVALVVDGEWWYMLENTADRIEQSSMVPDGTEPERGEFFVDGSNLQEVVEQIIEDDRADMPRTLWHTHVRTKEPSAEDIAEFPEWLADLGAIYHVPTGTTTLYNSAGVISYLEVYPSTPATTES